MKRVKVFLICILLLLQALKGNAWQQGTASLFDSVNELLGYFNGHTTDTGFKNALNNATLFCNKDSNIDSLVSWLLRSEEMLISMTRDSGVIGRDPYATEKLLEFGDATLKLSTAVLPVKDNLLYAAALHNLGMLNLNTNFLKSGELFEQALAIREKIAGKEDADYIKTLSKLALVYDAKGRREEAYSMIIQALTTTAQTKGKENDIYADALLCLASFCKQSRRNDTAIVLYEENLAIRRKIINDTSTLALHLCSAAITYFSIGKYKKAFALYREAAAITKQSLGEENFQYAWCLGGIGGMHYGMGEYENAIPYFERSLAIEKKLCDEGSCTGDIPVNLHDLATTYQRLGKYENALPLFQEAVAIEERQHENNGLAFDMPYLASLYQMMGKYDEAHKLIDQTIYGLEQLKNYGIDYIRTLNCLGSLYTETKEYKRAIPAFKEALQYTENIYGTEHTEYAATLNNMALAYKGMLRYDTAALLISQAATIRRNLLGDEHPYYAASLNDLGELYMLMGKYDSSKILYTQSLGIRKKVFGEEHPDYINSLSGLAMLDIMVNNNSGAAGLLTEANHLLLKHIDHTYTSLSEQEKIGYAVNQSSTFCILPSLLFTNSTMSTQVLQQVYTNELALKGMVLNDQQAVLNSIRKSNNKNVVELYNEWRLNKIYTGKQLLLPKNERVVKLDSILQATNKMEQQLSRVSVAFSGQAVVSPKNVSEKLKHDEAAIEFIRFQYYDKRFTDSILYAAIITLHSDSIPLFVPLFEEGQLIKLLNLEGKNANSINRFYAAKNSTGKPFTNSGIALYNLIWKPLEKYLTGINTIYYAPSGLLSRIAFEALPAVTNDDLLIDKYRLRQLLSTRSVALPSTITSKPSAINIWGDIQYNEKEDNAAVVAFSPTSKKTQTGVVENYAVDTMNMQSKKWPALNGTKLEAGNIKNIFKEAGINVLTITDTAATEEAFKTMDGKSPPVLHIATHGFFWTMKNKQGNVFAMQQDPMFRSGLVLAGANNAWSNNSTTCDKEDGILTSYEIAQLDLGNTDLVVLSACETALGDLQGNEGVMGLQRAFKLAGVKQMIISLWRIPDKQTIELMSSFYHNWLNGQTSYEALRTAQLMMKNKYPVYDWAGFVLVE